MAVGNFSILTYGCQMNKYDSERIAGILNKLSYTKTDNLSVADIILLNTCTVREKADQKVFSKLGRLKKLKKENPNLIIGVCGCLPQVQGKAILDRSPVVDFVFGTQNIHQLEDLIQEVRVGKKKRLSRILQESPIDYDPSQDPFLRQSSHHAWVSIMTGCDNYCSFCIVPYTRGRERSRKHEEIIRETENLAKNGYVEITLLGQNVNSYGKDIPGSCTFPELLKKINAVSGIKRIRFMTSHPKDLTGELIASMQELDKVCENVHLPLQSGSDKILKRMDRGYTKKEYMEKITKLKSMIPGITLTTDLIVGFPGESEDDFNETLKTMREVGFDGSFIFKYSPRPETIASSFPDRVKEGLVSERFKRLESLQKEIMYVNNKTLEGKEVEVLVEGESKYNPAKLMGKTRGNKIVIFQGPENLKGCLLKLEITRAGLYSLEGVAMDVSN